MNGATHQGSNAGALKILFLIVASSMLLGGMSNLLGPRNQLVGTWYDQKGSQYDIFRFEEDGSYWQQTGGGFISMNLHGTYEVVDINASTYQIRLTTEMGDVGLEYTLDSFDRLRLAGADKEDSGDTYERVDSWRMAKRPSKNAETYDGSRPHLGCWLAEESKRLILEIQDDQSLMLTLDGETTRAQYSVDYTHVPFHLDMKDENGKRQLEIFEFTADGALRVSNTNREDGTRPQEMGRSNRYVPCRDDSTEGEA